MKHKKNQIVRRKKPNKLSPAEQTIVEASIPSLINEFKKIQKKESNFSKHPREVVTMRINFLVKEGFIKSPEEILLCSHPFFDFNKCDLMKEINCKECEFVNPEFI